MLERQIVAPKRHLRQREPERGLDRIALGRVGDGGGGGGDEPAVDVDGAGMGGFGECVFWDGDG